MHGLDSVEIACLSLNSPARRGNKGAESSARNAPRAPEKEMANAAELLAALAIGHALSFCKLQRRVFALACCIEKFPAIDRVFVSTEERRRRR